MELVGREVARRTRRQFVELQTDARRRRAATRRRFWPARKPAGGEGFLLFSLDQALGRTGQVIALCLDQDVEQAVIQEARQRGYVVFIDKQEECAGGGTDAAGLDGELSRLRDDCDLYLGPHRLPSEMYASLIVHCFFS